MGMPDGAPAVDLALPLPLPRAVTRIEGLMLGAAARLDRFVLERYLSRTAFAAPVDGAALRERLVRAREFYGGPRFLDDPTSFFATPGPLQGEARRVGALRDGEVLDLRYTSDFVPVFPEAREDGIGTAARVPAIARWWRHREPGHPA